MAQYIREVNGRISVEFFLNGAIVGGRDMRKGDLFIHGLTLVFTGAVAATVTFDAGVGATAQTPMKLKTVMEQIATQTTNGIAGSIGLDGRATFVDAGVPTTAVGLDSASTALSAFGFKASTTIVGTFYNPVDGAAPRLLSISTSTINANQYLLLVEEV